MSTILPFSVSAVLAECGQISTFGKSQSGELGGNGSTRVTSSAGEADLPALERFDHRVFIDHDAARDIHQHNARFHRSDGGAIDQRIQAHCNADECVRVVLPASPAHRSCIT